MEKRTRLGRQSVRHGLRGRCCVSALRVLILFGMMAVANAVSGECLRFFCSQARAEALPTPESLMFIENVGQWDADARFQLWGGSERMWLTENAIWIQTQDFSLMSTEISHVWEDKEISPVVFQEEKYTITNLKLSFVGANPHPRIEPYNRLETSVNYFIGNDPTQWHTDVPVYAGLKYVNLCPGVDLEVFGESGQWQWRLVIHDEQFDLNQMKLRIEGVEFVSLLAEETALRLGTPASSLQIPLLMVNGSGVIAANTQLARVQRIAEQRFEVVSPFYSHVETIATYIPNSASSTLVYGTYLGGFGGLTVDSAEGIAVDSSDHAYVVGRTVSLGPATTPGGAPTSDFPTTPGAFDTTYNGNGDVFVVKLNPSGSALIYATFLGGRGAERAVGIAIDKIGNAYITGTTSSDDFPTTSEAFSTTRNGLFDAFVVKLAPSGRSLLYATLLGGTGTVEYYMGIAVDGVGNAYIVGSTDSSDFPTTSNAFDATHNGDMDIFLTKLNASGSSLVYSTFLGGSDLDLGYGIAIDEDGNAYVTGSTRSGDFPTTAGSFDTTLNSLGIPFADQDAFVTKLNALGSDLIYSTFVGGATGRDEGLAIAVDVAGNAYVTGRAYSEDFPTTPDAVESDFNGQGAFVTRLNSTGSELVYSTFLGKSSSSGGWGIAVDESENAYIVGSTVSGDFPTTSDAFQPTYNGNW